MSETTKYNKADLEETITIGVEYLSSPKETIGGLYITITKETAKELMEKLQSYFNQSTNG